MKYFTCTIESKNSCYVEGLLVVAEDEQDAIEKIKEYHTSERIVFTQPLKEVTMPNEGVLRVGWGCADNDNNFDD
jgi:hypothetical protein